MDCRPAVSIRNANGHDPPDPDDDQRDEALSPEQPERVPVARGPAGPTGRWFTRPVSRWNMNRQVMTAVKIGRAYGTRNSVRRKPRPRNGALQYSAAAAMPNSHANPTTSAVYRDGDEEGVQQLRPTGPLKSSRDAVVRQARARRRRPVADEELGEVRQAHPDADEHRDDVDQQLQQDGRERAGGTGRPASPGRGPAGAGAVRDRWWSSTLGTQSGGPPRGTFWSAAGGGHLVLRLLQGRLDRLRRRPPCRWPPLGEQLLDGVADVGLVGRLGGTSGSGSGGSRARR